MTRATLAVAADYADAMLVARRWKNALVLCLLLFILLQIGTFVFYRFYGGGQLSLSTSTSPTSQPVSSTHNIAPGFEWLINWTDFLAMVAVVVLAVALLLIVIVMLVGRLIGVSHVTSAFLWCVLLGCILFPWQSLWDYPVAGTTQSAPAPQENLEVGPRFGLPGVLYTWPELQHKYAFPGGFNTAAYLGWARFVGWPVVAIVILFGVQVRSSRGLKFALGEAEVHVADGPASTPPGAL